MNWLRKKKKPEVQIHQECIKDYGIQIAEIKRRIDVLSTFVHSINKIVKNLERKVDLLEDRLRDVDAYNAQDQEKKKKKSVISK